MTISFFFSFENHVLYEIMWKKYCRTGQVTYDTKAHAHCVLGTQGYKLTPRIFNGYCFYNGTMVGRTHVHVTLYVHYLSYSSSSKEPNFCILGY